MAYVTMGKPRLPYTHFHARAAGGQPVKNSVHENTYGKRDYRAWYRLIRGRTARLWWLRSIFRSRSGYWGKLNPHPAEPQKTGKLSARCRNGLRRQRKGSHRQRDELRILRKEPAHPCGKVFRTLRESFPQAAETFSAHCGKHSRTHRERFLQAVDSSAPC